MTDSELVRRALGGQSSAFEQLARRWSARVLAVCHARVFRRDLAEDLAQEALIRGFEQLATLQAPESFGPWLRGIAVHLCQDWRRSAAAREVPLSAVDESFGRRALIGGQAPIGSELELEEESQRLLAGVHALPEELRESVLLYYYDDLTYDELATLLGVSKATVNARLAKAREALRRQLSPAVR